MSLKRIDIDVQRNLTAERNSRARVILDSDCSALQYTLDQLEKAYAEIDRLTAENADLREQLKSLEREAAERDKAEPELVWKCPVSFKDGEYHWDGARIRVDDLSFYTHISLRILRDWTDPQKCGVWRVTEPGKAVWVRE